MQHSIELRITYVLISVGSVECQPLNIWGSYNMYLLVSTPVINQWLVILKKSYRFDESGSYGFSKEIELEGGIIMFIINI